jgi:hypothetical protein
MIDVLIGMALGGLIMFGLYITVKKALDDIYGEL